MRGTAPQRCVCSEEGGGWSWAGRRRRSSCVCRDLEKAILPHHQQPARPSVELLGLSSKRREGRAPEVMQPHRNHSQREFRRTSHSAQRHHSCAHLEREQLETVVTSSCQPDSIAPSPSHVTMHSPALHLPPLTSTSLPSLAHPLSSTFPIAAAIEVPSGKTAMHSEASNRSYTA